MAAKQSPYCSRQFSFINQNRIEAKPSTSNKHPSGFPLNLFISHATIPRDIKRIPLNTPIQAILEAAVLRCKVFQGLFLCVVNALVKHPRCKRGRDGGKFQKVTSFSKRCHLLKFKQGMYYL